MNDLRGTLRTMMRDDRKHCFIMRQTVDENRLDISYADYVAASDPLIDRGDAWVWDDDGRILGEAAVDRETGVIEVLYVDAASQGQGIGSALLQRCCDALAGFGYAEARLSTTVATRAEAFYLTRAFAIYAREGADTVFMRRRLSP